MFLVWMAYAMIAMFFDSWRRADIPGFGYLVLGFMAWMVGSVIFMVKAIRADLANPVDE